MVGLTFFVQFHFFSLLLSSLIFFLFVSLSYLPLTLAPYAFFHHLLTRPRLHPDYFSYPRSLQFFSPHSPTCLPTLRLLLPLIPPPISLMTRGYRTGTYIMI